MSDIETRTDITFLYPISETKSFKRHNFVVPPFRDIKTAFCGKTLFISDEEMTSIFACSSQPTDGYYLF
jgi:hypothetical protein